MKVNSIAIYPYEFQIKLSVNYNVWTSFNTDNYLDIAIGIPDNSQMIHLNVFLPFVIDNSDICDLTPFYRNEKIATVIMNAAFVYEPSFDKDYFCVRIYGDKVTAFRNIESMNMSLKTIDQKASLISMTIRPIKNVTWSWIIFRVPFKSLNEQIRRVISNRRGFIDALETPFLKYHYLMDFKINEARSLPHEIAKSISGYTIERQSFFLNATSDIEVDTNNCYKIRNIEIDDIKNYCPTEQFCHGGYSYMWRTYKNHSKIFNTKLTYAKLSMGSMSLYFLIIAIVNIISGLITNLISG